MSSLHYKNDGTPSNIAICQVEKNEGTEVYAWFTKLPKNSVLSSGETYLFSFLPKYSDTKIVAGTPEFKGAKPVDFNDLNDFRQKIILGKYKDVFGAKKKLTEEKKAKPKAKAKGRPKKVAAIEEDSAPDCTM